MNVVGLVRSSGGGEGSVPKGPQMLRFKRVCEVLGLPERTARRLHERGQFPVPCQRIGGRLFCRRIDVEKYVGRVA
jgi:predicted DNA-binding transcriptional regulator AlpA